MACRVGGAGPPTDQRDRRAEIYRLLARDPGGYYGHGLHAGHGTDAGCVVTCGCGVAPGVVGDSRGVPGGSAHAGVLRRVYHLRRGPGLRPGGAMVPELERGGRPQQAGGTLRQVEQPRNQPADPLRNGQPGRGDGPESAERAYVPGHTHRSDAPGMESSGQNRYSAGSAWSTSGPRSDQAGRRAAGQQRQPRHRDGQWRQGHRGFQQPGAAGGDVGHPCGGGCSDLRQLPEGQSFVPGVGPEALHGHLGPVPSRRMPHPVVSSFGRPCPGDDSRNRRQPAEGPVGLPGPERRSVPGRGHRSGPRRVGRRAGSRRCFRQGSGGGTSPGLAGSPRKTARGVAGCRRSRPGPHPYRPRLAVRRHQRGHAR